MADNITYDIVNIIHDKWAFTKGGNFNGGNLTINAGSTATMLIDKLDASTHFKLSFTPSVVDKRYTPDVLTCLGINFKDGNDTTPGVTQNIVHLTYEEQAEFIDAVPFIDIVSGELKVINNGTTPVTLNAISLVQAKKPTNEIVEVVEETVISVQVMHALLAWVSTLAVDRIETNVETKLIRAPYEQYREYITIKDRNIDFMESSLSETETEQLTLSINDELVPIWWTSIDDHPQAYKFFTLTPPHEVNKDITPDMVERFKVLARKELSNIAKLRILFTDSTFTGSDGKPITTHAPRMEWGGGFGQTNPDAGKGFITKYTDHFRLSYVKSNGDELAVIMGENGGELKGFNIEGGKGGILKNINLSNQSEYILTYDIGAVKLGIERDIEGRITKISPSNGTPFTINY